MERLVRTPNGRKIVDVPQSQKPETYSIVRSVTTYGSFTRLPPEVQAVLDVNDQYPPLIAYFYAVAETFENDSVVGLVTRTDKGGWFELSTGELIKYSAEPE